MKDIEGFILAGGASRRMGRDKAELRLQNKTFLEHAANSIYKITNGKISIVGNLSFKNLQINFDSGETFYLRVVKDKKITDSRAAIIGLHAALASAHSDWIVVVACDLPFVTADLFKRLASFAENKNFDAVVPLQKDDRPQPLCAFYKSESCLPEIETILNEKDWSLQNFLGQIKTEFVNFENIADLPDSELFFLNINTPEDYETAKKIQKK